MTTQAQQHGTKHTYDGRTFVEFTRTFRAPVEDVWAALTESDRLARWIGEWNGDPADGHVVFRMGFEGDEIAPERMQIDQCDAPHVLRLTSTVLTEDAKQQVWHFRIDLSEDAGVTTLVFAQDVPNDAMAEGVGPGWEYYLERLQVAASGGDPATVAREEYIPTRGEHYRNHFR